MPGPYAHITLLYEIMQPARLASVFSLSTEFDTILAEYFPYCALGAVSPDYPNLAGGDAAASQWADAMHCTQASEMITNGIRLVRESKGAARCKQLAWLLGYCAHVATDLTIHPVVQAKVGVYTENQRQHRICEMNQDCYIYRRMNHGEIGEKDSFALTIMKCCTTADCTDLDRDIVTLWEGMLEDVHPELFVTNPPDCTSWHREFVARVAGCSADQVRLFPLAWVISSKMELAYPSFDAVDRQYIDNQKIPSVKPFVLHYDDIFNLASGNVEALWRIVEWAVCEDNQANLPVFSDWNLDTGRDKNGRIVFWE